MKPKIWFALYVFFFTPMMEAQIQDKNVISYYAVGNSLDGQLMVGKQNVLRFYPVFAMRDSIDRVIVTVYFGSNPPYTQYAYKGDDNRFWESSLPRFKLGEAIQRIEVEVHFDLPGKFQKMADKITDIEQQNNTREALRQIYMQETKPEEMTRKYRAAFDDLKSRLNEVDVELGEAQVLRKAWQADATLGAYNAALAALEKKKQSEGKRVSRFRGVENTSKLFTIVSALDSLMNSAKSEYELQKIYLEKGVEIEKSRALDNAYLQSSKDSLEAALFREVEAGLADTLYSGPSVRKSDIIIDSSSRGARILYRNYKTSLRFMPALDPSERMGIFRLRYVPFPIVGTTTITRMHLENPMAASSPKVFEVGLAFGDAIVPGDDLVMPEFSWRRLGVAFAITEHLFNEDADIIGLALTYDFNSYGSIGLGGNFAQSEIHGYASLGINKKAFEAIVAGLASLFK